MDFAPLWLIWKPVARNLSWKNSSARWRHDDVIWHEWSFYARDTFTTVNWMNFRKILIASCSSPKKTTTVKKNQPVTVAVSRGSSLKIPLNPTNYMFFECISRDKSIGGKIEPVGPSTNRLDQKMCKNITFLPKNYFYRLVDGPTG